MLGDSLSILPVFFLLSDVTLETNSLKHQTHKKEKKKDNPRLPTYKTSQGLNSMCCKKFDGGGKKMQASLTP